PEAEECYKKALEYEANHAGATRGLAKCYMNTQRVSTAIVVLESIIRNGEPTAEDYRLYAKGLYSEGSLHEAQDAYARALQLDPQTNDPELDQELRMPANETSPLFEEDDEDWDDDDDMYQAPKNLFIEKPDTSFKDVGGLDSVKREVDLKIIKPLQNADLYAAYGKKVGGGILLYGPPGCGKTFLARATAGEVNSKFISIGISDVLDMWMGNSERRLHEIFEAARRNTPCVLFFDEIDALGANRADLRQSAGRNLINQFLSELDGLESNNDGLLIIGATNAPWHLDPAFRRPGRFDRIVFVSPPDAEAREAILQLKLEGKPQDKIDLSSVAKKTAEFSGADLEAVIDLAVEEKIEASLKTGVPEPLRTKDLIKAAKVHRASTKEWFNTARNYALYANDSGLYDEILAYLNIKK
ncbi:MAG: AAA family ATPase, partial [Bacteroidota bacterium]